MCQGCTNYHSIYIHWHVREGMSAAVSAILIKTTTFTGSSREAKTYVHVIFQGRNNLCRRGGPRISQRSERKNSFDFPLISERDNSCSLPPRSEREEYFPQSYELKGIHAHFASELNLYITHFAFACLTRVPSSDWHPTIVSVISIQSIFHYRISLSSTFHGKNRRNGSSFVIWRWNKTSAKPYFGYGDLNITKPYRIGSTRKVPYWISSTGIATRPPFSRGPHSALLKSFGSYQWDSSDKGIHSGKPI